MQMNENLRATTTESSSQAGEGSAAVTHLGVGYYSSQQLCDRFHCSKRTLSRWMLRTENPLPLPDINNHGAQSLWAIEAVAAWELRERERTRARFAQ